MRGPVTPKIRAFSRLELASKAYPARNSIDGHCRDAEVRRIEAEDGNIRRRWCNQTGPFATDSPDNREKTDNFSTGGDFHLAFGTPDAPALCGHCGINNTEKSDVNDDSMRGRNPLKA